MDKFLGYYPAVIYPGQGPVVKEPHAKLNELILHRKQREQQIVELLQDARRSIEELVAALYSGLHERMENLAKIPVKSHLIKLEKEVRMVASGDIY